MHAGARGRRRRSERWLLLLTVHHVAYDGASGGVLHGELGALYGALRAGGIAADAGLAPMRLQYVDFAVWQREALSGVLEGQLSYWRSQLREGVLPVLELPLDYARPAVQTFAGGSVPVRIGAGWCRGWTCSAARAARRVSR